jgi:hypothetical protein
VAGTFLDSPAGSRALSHNGYMHEHKPPRIGVVAGFYSSRQTSAESRIVALVADAKGQIAPHYAAADSRVRDVRPIEELGSSLITAS